MDKQFLSLKARANRARKFPENTCPASRHAHMIAEQWPTKRGYPMLTEEREHCAGSILSTVASLYEARTRIRNLEEWIAREGGIADVCTRNILGKVCSNCRCGKAPRSLEAVRPVEMEREMDLFKDSELATISMEEAERRVVNSACYAMLMLRQLQHAKRLRFQAYDVASLVEANLQTAIRAAWQPSLQAVAPVEEQFVIRPKGVSIVG